MFTAKAPPLRPLLRSFTNTTSRRTRSNVRTFLPFPFPSPPSTTKPQTLTATATLPYPSAPIYTLIADVPNYSLFLPYCLFSTVTSWSAPDATYNRRWPSEGRLVIGFKGIQEEFTSRVYCVPGSVVESVGGGTQTSLREQEIAHHLGDEGDRSGGNGDTGSLLSHLRNRWTVEPLGKDQTRVTLALEYAFTNPLYSALSAGAAPMVADIMVKAFEQRARSMLENDPEMRNASLEDLDGSQIKKR